MEEAGHGSFSGTWKILVFLPLLALAAAALWLLFRARTEEYSGREPAAAPLFRETRPESPAARERPKYLTALDIQGPPEFKSQVTGALKLIWMADRDTFLFIRNRLYSIRNESKTDFYMDAGGHPVAAISSAHALRSMPWCAGIIAHQAYHAHVRLSTKKKKAFTPPPPGLEKQLRVAANPMIHEKVSLPELFEREKRASEFQLRIMEGTGASRSELRLVRDRDPRDFSTGHDGNYSPE